MKILLSVGLLLFWASTGLAQMTFTVTGKAGSTAQVTLTAPVVAVVQVLVDQINKNRKCDLIAKTCPGEMAFHTVVSFVEDRVNEAFASYAKDVAERQKTSACKAWKELSVADQDAIKAKLGGAPCD